MRFNKLIYQILVVFTVVIVVCLGASGWFLLWVSEDIVTRNISEGYKHLAQRIAQEVEAEIISVKPVLTLLAESRGLRLMEPMNIKSEIDRTQKSFPEITSIYVAGVDGMQIARTGTEELENVSNVWGFQVAMRGDEIISDIYPAPLTSEPMRSIILPIRNNGRVIGVVFSDVSFGRVMNSVMDVDVGKNGSVAVVANNGRVIAHTYMEQLPELDLSMLPVVEAVLAGQEGSMQGYTDELGRQVIGVYSPIPELGWGIVIQKPLGDIDADIGQLRTTIQLATVGAVFLAVLAGWLMSRQITRPIRQLAVASEQVAQGDLSTAVEVRSSNEIGVLASSFNQMLESLKKSRNELEQRVVDLQRAESDLRRYTEQLEALRKASLYLTSSLALQPLLEVILEQTLKMVPADNAHIFLYDGKRLTFGAVRWVDELKHGPYADPRQNGLTYTVARSGERVAIPDMNNHPLYQDQPRNAAIIGIPLISSGQVRGVMNVAYDKPHAYDEAEIRIIELLADQAAVAIMNAQLYEQVQNYTVELEQRVVERTAELAVAKNKAEEADRLKSAFLATMSHELRTPLNSIIGFTGIMLQGLAGPLNDEQTKQLGMVNSSASHLLDLINDVLDISKIEAGQLEITSELFNMREVIDKVVLAVRPQFERKDLALVTTIAPDVDQIVCDERRVEQILINLVGNAIKFTEKGEVSIECEISNGWLMTRVVDTGMGIKAKDMDILFEAFQQIDTGLTRQHEGTGLGLSICKKLLEALGGEIWVESEWGVGSTFTFTLPMI